MSPQGIAQDRRPPYSTPIGGDVNRPRFLRLTEVAGIIGVHKATIWRWIQAGRFPQPIRPVPRTAYWLQSDLDEWNGLLLAERRSSSSSTEELRTANESKSNARKASGRTRRSG